MRIENGEWKIKEVNGEAIPSGMEKQPFIAFDVKKKSIHGNAGCNRMMGAFELDSVNAGKIKLTQMGMTRMMCPDMDVETKVLGVLDKVNGYVETPEGIALTDADGKTLMNLEKRQLPEYSVNDLAGEWIISTVNGTELEKQENVPFLAFNIEEKRVHGNASCNVVNGGFMQEEGKENSLKFSQMISTMMACPNMDTERLVLEALNKVASFTLDQDKSKLSLLDENGTEVMSLTKNAGETLSK